MFKMYVILFSYDYHFYVYIMPTMNDAELKIVI